MEKKTYILLQSYLSFLFLFPLSFSLFFFTFSFPQLGISLIPSQAREQTRLVPSLLSPKPMATSSPAPTSLLLPFDVILYEPLLHHMISSTSVRCASSSASLFYKSCPRANPKSPLPFPPRQRRRSLPLFFAVTMPSGASWSSVVGRRSSSPSATPPRAVR